MAQDGSKRQALAARLAQKRVQKSVLARQLREIGVLDRWKQTLEDRNEQNNEKNANPHVCVGPGWLQKAGTGNHIGPNRGPKICPCQAVSRNWCVGQMETYFGRLKRKKNEKTLIPMSAWAQDGSKRQALAAILAQKGAQKSVHARQFREIGELDRWKQT